MDKYTGKRLDGRYEIQELIGVGGMAMVYKAHDNLDDKTVAIKILKDEFLGNEEFIRRFKNESKAIAVLSHPNIVKVYDVSFGDRIQYIVMEYIDGITLKEYIGQQNVIPWKEAVHFTVQILQALQHAHEKGIVHRDVKPQNIMLLQDGTIKVTDFGIARFSNRDTRTMTDKAIGSVHYIAPEQAKGSVTDGKADIYSVGVMLYEMLTGTLPFEADSAVSVAIMQLEAEPKPLREINPDIPIGLEQITLRAMRKIPVQRFASADEMLEAIDEFRKNPTVKFNYTYFEDKAPTKYVDKLETKRPAKPEPSFNDDYGSYDDGAAVNHTKTIVKVITVFVGLMVLAAIAFLVYTIFQNAAKQNEIESVDVPNFIGQMIDEVKSNKSYKFNFEVSAKYDNSQPVNVILSQDPEAGSKQIKENATIKLTINSKSTKTDVPKVKNYTEQQAIEKIEAKYLGYDIQRVYSSEVAKGYVIDCSPQEGTEQEIGTPITLIVSDGTAPDMVEVPDVAGQSYDKAKSNLESLGFKTQKRTDASGLAEGTVINTDPLPGNTVSKDRIITIAVSDGSKVLKPLAYTVELPEDEYAEVTVKVILNESSGTNTVLSETSGIPGEGMNVEIKLNPDNATNYKKQVTVMLDDQKWETLVFNFKDQRVDVSNSSYKNSYKVKKGSLKGEINAAIDDLNSYIDLEEYPESLRKDLEDIINHYTQDEEDDQGLFYLAESAEEIETLLSEAKDLIRKEIEDYNESITSRASSDTSSSESSNDESSDEESSEDEPVEESSEEPYEESSEEPVEISEDEPSEEESVDEDLVDGE